MFGSRGDGDRGSAPQLKNHEAIWYLSNTGLDTMKNHQATKSTFNFGLSLARWVSYGT